MTITNVAKPKKRPARKKPKSKPIDVSADTDADVESPNAELKESAESMTPMEPVIGRPLLFKISLVAFVSWLIYLAYIAYVVLR